MEEKKFQVYTGTYGIMSNSYEVPENLCWDNQKLVHEANSMKEINKVFDRRADYKWRENSTFRHSESGCLEIHCKSNQGLKILPPKIEGDNILYYIPRGKEPTGKRGLGKKLYPIQINTINHITRNS